jgi:hypothetical protein
MTILKEGVDDFSYFKVGMVIGKTGIFFAFFSYM